MKRQYPIKDYIRAYCMKTVILNYSVILKHSYMGKQRGLLSPVISVFAPQQEVYGLLLAGSKPVRSGRLDCGSF